MSLAVAMYIGDSEFKGQAPGPFVGLDLTEDLYVGAVPDFGRIARAAGFGNGFTGQSITASVIPLFPPRPRRDPSVCPVAQLPMLQAGRLPAA